MLSIIYIYGALHFFASRLSTSLKKKTILCTKIDFVSLLILLHTIFRVREWMPWAIDCSKMKFT